MALTLPSDMKLVNELIETGYSEVVTQSVETFFNASGGAVVVENAAFQGDFVQRNFIKEIANLVTRRVNQGTGADAAATSLKAVEGDQLAARLARKIGPVDVALGALRSRNFTMEGMSLQIGQQIAKAELANLLNSATASLVGALSATTGAFDDLTGTGASGEDGLTYNALIDLMALAGDTSGDIAAWIMPSKAYFQLMKDAKDSSKISDIVGAGTLYEGTVASFGRPVIVTDSASLLPSGDAWVGALKAGAITLRNDAMPIVYNEIVSGGENLIMRVQGEFEAAITIGGYRYGGSDKNPTDAVLVNTANWALDASTVKHAPAGFLVKVD